MGDTLSALYDRLVAEGAIRPDPAQSAVLSKLQAIRDRLEVQVPRSKGLRSLFVRAPDPPRGLYLWGGVGRGKSMLVDLFVTELSVPAKRRVHFHAFMQEVHAGMTAARKRGVTDALAPVADAVADQVRCLAFDEMQITDITDAMIVGRLFERLLNAGVVIVTTSNRSPDDLYRDGLNRALFVPFIDLIKQRMDVVELESPTDYRQHRLAGAQVWFAPASGARPALDAIWTDLAGGGTAQPLTLKLQGRETVIPAFLNGVARATFWELCGRPLGPADYLALAAAARVMMIEDIPRLSAANYNEAKRFVTLVDALYEARVRVIASAADEPEKLYIEGAGTFEFERTASRLREMQAADWGVS